MNTAEMSSVNALLATLCAVLVFPAAAQAKWKSTYANAPPNIIQWYKEQHNAEGEWCCDKSDGHAFYGDYTLDQNGDVEFDAAGTHYHLPAYIVLQGANPTGHAVWWYVVQNDGTHSSFCFALGVGG